MKGKVLAVGAQKYTANNSGPPLDRIAPARLPAPQPSGSACLSSHLLMATVPATFL